MNMDASSDKLGSGQFKGSSSADLRNPNERSKRQIWPGIYTCTQEVFASYIRSLRQRARVRLQESSHQVRNTSGPCSEAAYRHAESGDIRLQKHGASPIRGGSVLTIDDDPSVRHAIERTLSDQFSIWHASSGAEALRILSSHDIDVAIVDVKMPGISGLDLLPKLRVVRPGTQVIMFTAHDTGDLWRQAFKAGAVDVIIKPHDVDKLRSVVCAALQRKRAALEYGNHAGEDVASMRSMEMSRILWHTRREMYANLIPSLFDSLSQQFASQPPTIARESLTAVDSARAKSVAYLADCPERPSVNECLQDLANTFPAALRRDLSALKIELLPDNVEVNVPWSELVQILRHICYECLTRKTSVKLVPKLLSRIRCRESIANDDVIVLNRQEFLASFFVRIEIHEEYGQLSAPLTLGNARDIRSTWFQIVVDVASEFGCIIAFQARVNGLRTFAVYLPVAELPASATEPPASNTQESR